ncbi:MAG TPA: molybdenum cofactor guanylyltransferase [Opitutaceae bacterium]
MKLAGAVMAGGQSRRMGFDKALLAWEGEPLWARQCRILAAAGAEPVAIVRRTDQSALGAVCWRDLRTDCGPLAGLETALIGARDAGASRVAVLAVDMPDLKADWFRWLLATAPEGMAARTEAHHEPLAAIYPVAALPVIQSRLDAGLLSLQALLDVLVQNGLMASFGIPTAFLPQIRSVNTVEACPSIIATLASPPRAPDSTK